MDGILGTRVLRGPDWDKGDEDGGEGHVGSIIELLSNQTVRVLWDTGEESTCRAGADGKFDLRIFDTAQIGVRHPNTTCAECGEKNVYGMLWRCDNYDLCPLCYHDDKRDLRHQFLRIDGPGCEGITVKKRKSSVKIRTVGMFPGAKVTRGRHWMWDDQDGGPGSEGEVKGYENVVPDSSRNLVRVQWSMDGDVNSYRLGFQGQVDLKCVEEEVGPLCYRDHLPLLDITKPARESGSAQLGSASSCNFNSNDDTKIFSAANFGKDRNTHNGHGNKMNSSDSSLSGAGLTMADTATKRRAGMSGIDGCAKVLNGSGAEETTEIVAGDRAAVAVGADKLRQLQEDFDSCSDGMIKVIGETGEVTEVSVRQAVTVKFKCHTYRFNPKALVKVYTLTEGVTVRIRPDEDQVKILNSKVGWKPNMSAAIGKVGRVLKIDNEGDVLVGFGPHFFIFAPACCVPASGVSWDSLTLSTPLTVSMDKTSAQCPERPAREEANSPVRQESVSSVYRVLRDAMGVGSDISGIHRLLYVIQQHDHRTVRAMCQSDRRLLEAECNRLTPLMLACAEGYKKTVDVLVKMGADVNHAIGQRRTPIAAALEGRNEDIFEELLHRGADPFRVDERLHCYLHIAAFYDLPRAIQLLAARGVDVNAKDYDDNRPLHVAIEKKSNKAVEALVQHPAIDLKAKNVHDYAALHWAALRGNPQATELILEKDKSQVDLFRHGSSTPLHIAAINDHDRCVRILVLNGGANINQQDHAGASYTPLHLACLRGKFRSAEALLEMGADVHLRDTRGDTPLHLSIGGRNENDTHSEAGRQETQQRVAIACMLISKGAYVDAENNKGRNPMLYGVEPVREGVKSFIKHNKHLVKRKGTTGMYREKKSEKYPSYSMSSYHDMGRGVSSYHGMGRGDLKEALKEVGLPCGVCGNSKSDVTLQPCQHKCVCSTCKDKVTKCPLCDYYVTEKIVTGPDENPFDLEALKLI